MTIPVFFRGVKNLVYQELYEIYLFENKHKINNIKNKYNAMTAIYYVFLFLIIFLERYMLPNGNYLSKYSKLS